MKSPAGGGPVVPLATNLNFPAGLAADGVNVYYSTGDGEIAKIPVGGGTATVLARGEQGTVRLAVDDSFVYWNNTCFGTIKKIAK
jgi:hypothetical protein